MKVAAAQLCSNDDISQNLQNMIFFAELASKAKAELVIFPENALFFRIIQESKVKAISMADPALKRLKQTSDNLGIALHFTTAISEENDVFNASVLLMPNHEPQIVYRKIHLFDISLQDQKPIRESDVFKHGETPNIFAIKDLKFGSSICYDVRFSELYYHYARAAVDVIVVPAAFLVKTGQAHWEVLLRARAIESQCYVIAPAQSGTHKSIDSSEERQTYGHTLIIDPWGKILSDNVSEIGLTYVEISKDEILKVRQQIPMKDHRRI